MIHLLEVRLPSQRSTVHKLAGVLGYCAKAGLHRLWWFRRYGMFLATSLITRFRYPNSALSSACFRCSFGRKFVLLSTPADQRVLTGSSCISAKLSSERRSG